MIPVSSPGGTAALPPAISIRIASRSSPGRAGALLRPLMWQVPVGEQVAVSGNNTYRDRTNHQFQFVGSGARGQFRFEGRYLSRRKRGRRAKNRDHNRSLRFFFETNINENSACVIRGRRCQQFPNGCGVCLLRDEILELARQESRECAEHDHAREISRRNPDAGRGFRVPAIASQPHHDRTSYLNANDICNLNRKAPSARWYSPRARQIALEDSGGTSAVAMATPTKATLSRGEIME